MITKKLKNNSYIKKKIFKFSLKIKSDSLTLDRNYFIINNLIE